MEHLNNSAHARLRERAYTIGEEAGDPTEVYSMWHKLRPMLRKDFPVLAGETGEMVTARNDAKARKA